MVEGEGGARGVGVDEEEKERDGEEGGGMHCLLLGEGGG